MFYGGTGRENRVSPCLLRVPLAEIKLKKSRQNPERTHHKMQYSIGDVAKLIGTSKEAIRYFERLGYIDPPDKTQSGYRYYDVYTSGILR